MALSTQPYKGARDFYPEDKRVQKFMFNKIRSVAERFGYEEYDAPILEPIELYLSKTSEEVITEQSYTFTDRGDRQVIIRPEMTPSVSRMIAAKRQELTYPIRWYSMPNLWRYERPQRGRLREFWQPNFDLFGVEGIEADHEIIMLADQVLKAFGAKADMYTIKVNSRKLINTLMQDELVLDKTQSETLIRLIDRLPKMEYGEFVGQLDTLFSPSQRDAGANDKLLKTLEAKTIEELPEALRAHSSVQELRKLMGLLEESSVTNAVFDVTLMRGFDYYTDIVFEVFDNHPDNNRAMYGGGRYDGLVGLFGVEPVPSVGFAMGDVPLAIFLRSHDLLPDLKPETELYAVLIGDDTYARSQRVFRELRRMGVRIAVDSTGRKPEKQLKTAIKKAVPYAIFIGERELKEEQFTIKNLHTAQEERHSLQRIVSIIKRRDNAEIDDE
jgi:histidyl-tRNA synthetase